MRIISCIKFIFFGLCFLHHLGLWSQTPSFRWEGGISANHKFNEKWSLNTQLLGRETFNDYGSEEVKPFTDRLEIKPFLTYSLFNQRKLTLGYMYRSIDPFNADRGVEHRITQQFAFLSTIRSYRIAQRIRLEERIFEDEVVFRLRYQFSYDKPLQGETLDPGELYGLVSNEFVFSVTSESGELQNRFGLGIGKLFKKRQKLQFSLTHRYSDLLTEANDQILQFKSVYYFSL